MQSLAVQRGMSYWSFFFGAMLLAIAVQVGVATIPSYIDDTSINKAIEARLQSQAKDGGVQEFIQGVDQQLSLNGIRDYKAKDILTVTNDNGLVIHKQYTVKKQLFGNLSLVMEFDKTFDQKTMSVHGA